jgi:mercuric ion transport protein
VSRAWKQLLTIPGIGVSLLPKIACPLCWPSYGGLLGSLGLGFLISGKYLLPLTGAFLVLTVGALAFGAKRRHGYGPFGLGIMASGGVLLGKFAWESTLTIYATVGLLMVASAWNAWPHRSQGCRPDCGTLKAGS